MPNKDDEPLASMSSEDQSKLAELHTDSATNSDVSAVPLDKNSQAINNESDTAALRKSMRDKKLALKAKENKTLQLTQQLVKTIDKQLEQNEGFLEKADTLSDKDVSTFMSLVENCTHTVSDIFDEVETLVENKVSETTQAFFNEFMTDVRLVHDYYNQRKETELKQEEELIEAERVFEEAKKKLEEEMKELETHMAVRRARLQQKLNKPRVIEDAAQHTEQTPSQPDMAAIVTSLTDGLTLKRQEDRPIQQNEVKADDVKPSVFAGDPLEFNDWEIDFDGYVEAEGLTGKAPLRYLKKFVDKDAKDCISGYFTLNSEEAYLDARRQLRRRYGRNSSVSRAMREKPENWPKINPMDDKELQKFADFLSQIKGAMASVPELKILNDSQEIDKIAARLPRWLKTKWVNQARQIKRDEDRNAVFSEFFYLINDQAEIQCEPLLAQDKPSKEEPQNRSRRKTLHSFSTSISKGPKRHCTYCEKDDHDTAICSKLVAMSYIDTLAFFNQKRLCYSCTKSGHMTSQCREKVKCRKCKGDHPQCLHKTAQDWENGKLNSHSHTVRTERNKTENKPEASSEPTQRETKQQIVHAARRNITAELLNMVVPVYISANDSVDEVLVYALLDSGSDSTYITRDIANQIRPPSTSENVTVTTLNGDKTGLINKHKNTLLTTHLAQKGEFDDLDDRRKASQNDIKFVKILEEGITRDAGGSITLPLPFKDVPFMPNNRSQAERRLNQLIQRFKRDSILKKEYFNFMQEMIDNGHAEPVAESTAETGQVWYLPHFSVYHPRKGKIRVVFDASVHFQNKCLNEELLPGPDHINSLVGILLRFRTKPIALSRDIQKMFLNFKVTTEHRDYLSVASAPEAIKLIGDATKICADANLRLHKFASNNRDVLKSIPITERASEPQGLVLYKDKLPAERTLGLEWRTDDDCFTFSNNLTKKPNTRRGILSVVSQIYDPLGLLAPFLLQGKMIMQRACKESEKWDDDVPEDIANDWNRWKSQLDELQDISIPRCLTPGLASNFKNWKYTELHHFCDASLEGYGACSYLRLVDSNDHVHTALIMAKSRVAPLKSMTIPRLELQAAVEAVRLKCQLESELDMAVDTQYIWTDSTATLGFINSNEAKFHMFVANRVAEIRRCSSVTQWHHVPGSVNPADLASRGCTLSALKKSNWFTGPAFLRKLDLSAHLANKADYCEFIQNSVEVKKPKQVLSTQSATNDTLDEIVKRFSLWTRLVRAITNAKAMLQNKSFKRPATTAEDLCQAESHIIKLDQKQAFDKEISQLEKKETLQKNSKIRKLVPYLDENNMLRMSSRTTSPLSYRERNPIILFKSQLTKLLVTHYHQITHQGHNSAITALRQAGYWITGVSTLAKGIVHHCVKCRINRARPEEQQMGLLPKERTEPSPPFTHIGIDTFGHFFVKDRRTELKRWGVIFTCLYTRAIHIELIDDFSTDSFLQALRRFQAVRGPVTTVFSDAGTNFVGGRNQMEQDLLNMRSKELKDYLMTKKIKFETNTPTASHQGGVWERQIRTIRSILQGMS
ncbi:uncharacterized protein [Watersipora subatra]|uniref:uncharacterized protein n=1 Tax=Watersipora subatra TaxID=2589382 RepID=UPI00355B313B